MTTFDYRYVARITVEADTPLAVSSGEKDILTDALISTDSNELPMIYGTSLTGVIRHLLEEILPKNTINQIFGYQCNDEGIGSRIIISSAHILDENGKVVEGLINPQKLNSDYFKWLKNLPIRDHCKIGHRGASDKTTRGKYDNQIVPKGVRFKFEIEFIGNKEDKENWEKICNIISHPVFRIGSKTRVGLGKLKVIDSESEIKTFDLKKDLESYLNKSSSLNYNIDGEKLLDKKLEDDKKYVTYKIYLDPEDLWVFSSGFSDEDADNTPKYEDCVKWENGKAKIIPNNVLMPASSIKGVISHRTAFHYNRIKKIYADKVKITDHVGEKNAAVKELFGCAKNSQNKEGQIGKVIFSDVFLENRNKVKKLNHVAIDRFTGGAIDSALFNQKVIYQKPESGITLEITATKDAFQNDEAIKKAFESAINDIASGMLPLGGSVMKGHGIFSGKWEI